MLCLMQLLADEKASEDDSDTEVLPTSRRARVKKGNSDSPKPPKKAALKVGNVGTLPTIRLKTSLGCLGPKESRCLPIPC